MKNLHDLIDRVLTKSNEKFYTVNEVSKILGVSTRTVYYYLYRGMLKGTKRYNRTLVKESDLENFKHLYLFPKD